MSSGHFCRLFKKYTFKTPVQYINGVRLSAATDLLLESDRKVLEMCIRDSLSTVQNSDAIMVLDHGRIIERGTHDQLIAQHGTYYQLYTGALELE